MRKFAIAFVFFTLSAAAQVTPKTVRHFMSDDGKTKLTGLFMDAGRVADALAGRGETCLMVCIYLSGC